MQMNKLLVNEINADVERFLSLYADATPSLLVKGSEPIFRKMGELVRNSMSVETIARKVGITQPINPNSGLVMVTVLSKGNTRYFVSSRGEVMAVEICRTHHAPKSIKVVDLMKAEEFGCTIFELVEGVNAFLFSASASAEATQAPALA